MTNVRSIAAVTALLVLAGCGSGSKSGEASSGAASTPAASGGSYGADWARKPCDSFPVAAAAKASGMAITKAEPGSLVEQDGIVNGTCGYTDDAKGHFRVGLHIDTGGKQTIDSQIADMAARPDTTGKMQSLTAATGKAFWLPLLHSVVYYPDDQRSITVVAPGYSLFGESAPEDQQKSKALAIALAAAA